MPIVAANALAWALKNWKMLLGGLVLAGLSLALLLAKADAHHWQKLDTQHVASLQIEVDKNAINLASIGSLENELTMKSRESDDRAAAFAESHAQSASDVSKADAAHAADKGRSDALRALAKDLPKQPGCDAPAAVLSNLKGL